MELDRYYTVLTKQGTYTYIRSSVVASGFPRLVLVYSPLNILSANRSSSLVLTTCR